MYLHEDSVGSFNTFRREYYESLAISDDPDFIAEYSEEIGRSPEMEAARDIQQMGGQLIVGLQAVLEQKEAAEALPAAAQEISDEEPVEPDQPEVIILTAEEKLHARLQSHYETGYQAYLDNVAGITATKKSKRAAEERRYLGEFARDFCDLRSVTGDEHLVLRADLLTWAYDNLVDDPVIKEKVTASAVEFTKKHVLQVTENPVSFAAILSGSMPERPHAEDFTKILGIIFSSFSGDDARQVQTNLAKTSLELLKDFPTLIRVADIAFAKDPLVSPTFLTLAARGRHEVILKDIKNGTYDGAVNEFMTQEIFANINLATGQRHNRGTLDFLGVGALEQPGNLERVLGKASEIGLSIDDALNGFARLQELFKGIAGGLPIEARALGYEAAPIVHQYEIPPELEPTLRESELFSRYMAEFGTNTYPIIFGDLVLGTTSTHKNVYLMSPSLSLYIASDAKPDQLGTATEKPLPEEAIMGIMYHILSTYAIKGTLSVAPYSFGGKIKIAYMPLGGEGEPSTIAIVRPATEYDRNLGDPMSQLNLNMAKLDELNLRSDDQDTLWRAESEQLREEIRLGQHRMLGRRPVKFKTPSRYYPAGLRSISVRTDGAAGIKALVSLEDGNVELELDNNLRFKKNNASPPAVFYENLILKLVKIWACSTEVETSDGTVSEKSGISANMGHFGYLRIKDGKRWGPSETQARIYLEEQANRGTTLEEESLRLEALDDAIDEATGLRRRSTYYREQYDPSIPALEVYYNDKDLAL